MSQGVSFDPEVISASEPEIGKRFELIDGRKVEKPPKGNIQTLITGVLNQSLGSFARTNKLGRVLPGMLFWIDRNASRMRRSDVAFVSYRRLPRDEKVNDDDGFDVAPELAIELVSPSNEADEVVRKIRDYFRAGVLQVWIVYPSVRQVYVYESPRNVTILADGDDLDGGDLLPGFRLSLAELFEDAE